MRGALVDFPWEQVPGRRSPLADSPFYAGFPGGYQPTIRFGMGDPLGAPHGGGGGGGGHGGGGHGGGSWAGHGGGHGRPWGRGGGYGRGSRAGFRAGAWRRWWAGAWWAWGWGPGGWSWSLWPSACASWSQPLVEPPADLAAAAQGYLQQAGASGGADAVSFDWTDGNTYLATSDGAIRACTY